MENVHATTVEINGAGVLILGRSGEGKSDLALRLIENKGAVLVADDRTDLSVENGCLMASCPENIKGLLEVRGVGIVRMPFVKTTCLKLVLEACLEQKVERHPAKKYYHCQGVMLPYIRLNFFEASTPDKVVVKLKSILEEQKQAS